MYGYLLKCVNNNKSELTHPCEIWNQFYLIDDKSTLVQVMVWCHCHCCLRSLSPCGVTVTRPQELKDEWKWKQHAQDTWHTWWHHQMEMKWEYFPRYWPLVQGIHLSPMGLKLNHVSKGGNKNFLCRHNYYKCYPSFSCYEVLSNGWSIVCGSPVVIRQTQLWINIQSPKWMPQYPGTRGHFPNQGSLFVCLFVFIQYWKKWIIWSHAIHIHKLLYVDTYISFIDMFSFIKHIR